MDPEEICEICFYPPNKSDKHYTHYGAICCFSCKAFFRRTVRDNLSPKFVCKKNKTCDFSLVDRASCRKCRYEKCLEVGLNPKKVLIDDKERKKFTHPKKNSSYVTTNSTVDREVHPRYFFYHLLICTVEPRFKRLVHH